MKHKCTNFIENGECIKCRTPEWAVFFHQYNHKIGSKIRLPLNYSDGGKEFFILAHDKRGYTIGRRKDTPPKFGIQMYAWWELYPVAER